MARTEERRHAPPWRGRRFDSGDTDPLAGFANIMDVMLVFALGLLIALIAQSRELRQHFELDNPDANRKVPIKQGRELAQPPEAIKQALNGQAEGMESLGQVYRDPATGKLILLKQ